MINRYVLPHIGRVPLRSLTVTHLEDLYARLRNSGRHDGGPLAPKTVLNVHQILRTALGDAERAGLVHRNVARLMDPPCHGAAPEQRCWERTPTPTVPERGHDASARPGDLVGGDDGDASR
jgi:integrase